MFFSFFFLYQIRSSTGGVKAVCYFIYLFLHLDIAKWPVQKKEEDTRYDNVTGIHTDGLVQM